MDVARTNLIRLPDQGVLGGVCAGLSSHLGIDVSIIRALFVASTIFTGFGAVFYLALWWLLAPTKPGQPLGSSVTIGADQPPAVFDGYRGRSIDPLALGVDLSVDEGSPVAGASR